MADKPDTTTIFRDGLEATLAVVEALVPVAKSLDELIGMVKLAMENDGQLRLLLGLVQARTKERKQ